MDPYLPLIAKTMKLERRLIDHLQKPFDDQKVEAAATCAELGLLWRNLHQEAKAQQWFKIAMEINS
jgi:hypothetical protein